MPVRHGLTIGEMALWLNARFDIGAGFRSRRHEGMEAPHVLRGHETSPGFFSFAQYADDRYGSCVSRRLSYRGNKFILEGRVNYPSVLEMIGAPFINADQLARGLLNRDNLPGITLQSLPL